MQQSNMKTSVEFLYQLKTLHKPAELQHVQRFFSDENIPTNFIGVKMASLFALAKAFITMPLSEIEILLTNEYYEARMGAVCIMDFQARAKKITPEQQKALYELYLENHAYINNWDMVDRAAPYVIGGYLFDKPRDILYKLAKSKNVYERRTAIVATYYFIRLHQVDDTFALAEIMVNDKAELVNKAVGSWIREAGKQDPKKLLKFLDAHAATMPRITLRYAIEKLPKEQKAYYMDKEK
jgi:3-methyladenine DNA glycosylase AlkD